MDKKQEHLERVEGFIDQCDSMLNFLRDYFQEHREREAGELIISLLQTTQEFYHRAHVIRTVGLDLFPESKPKD